MGELHCICRDIPMSAILREARRRGFSDSQQIAAAGIACDGCTLCRPYVDRMLRTGKVPTAADALAGRDDSRT